jgi:hypothetical protein
MGLGAALTLAGCLFATGVLLFLCWFAVEAFGFFLF